MELSLFLKLRGSLLATLLAVAAVGSGIASAASIVLSDFDNTLVETRKFRDGVFSTPFRLFPIAGRTHALERVPLGALPESATPLEVTPIDIEELRKFLAHSSEAVENRNRWVTLESGEQIRPGDYSLRYPDSYQYFLASPKGRNYPLENLKSALQRRDGVWQGPYWSYAMKILANPATASSFRLLTARGHEAREWQEFFEFVRSDLHPEISIPPTALFHNVSRPEFDSYNIRRNVAEAKLQIVSRILASFATLPLSDADLRLNADGTAMARLHYLAIAEDSQENLAPIVELFQSTMRSKRIPIKLGIFNVGLPTEIKDSGRKQFVIVKSDGSFRAATEDEIIGDPRPAAGTGAGACRSDILNAAQ